MSAKPFFQRSPLLLIAFAVLSLLLTSSLHGATPAQRSTSFDGSTSTGVGYGDSTQYEPAIAMTVEAWIYRENASRGETIIGRNFTRSYWFGIWGGKLRFYRSGGTFADSDVSIGEKNWVHVAASYNGTSVRFYVDGVLAGNKVLGNTAIQYTEPLFIGSDGTAYPFLGYMDEVRIWSGTRTQNEIQQNLFREFQGGESGLVLYQPFGGSTDSDRAAVFGILPRALRIPTTSGIALDGVVDPVGEYAGAEQFVIRYGNNAGTPDAVAYLKYRNYKGNPLLNQDPDRNLYVGVKNIRVTQNNWPSTDSWIALHFDPDLSRDTLAQTGDFQVQLPIDGPGDEDPEARWKWGDGVGSYAAANPPASSIAESAIHYARGDVNPPDMEFRIGDVMFPNWLSAMGVSFGHYWIGGVGQDKLAPGDAVWNSPATWTTANFSEPDPPINITGTILNENDDPIEGVFVVANGPLSGYVQTDAAGQFIFPNFPVGNYTVAPSLDGYIFAPESIELIPLISSQHLEFVGFTDGVEPHELLLPETPSGITLRMNACLYEPGDALSLALDVNGRIPLNAKIPVFVVSQPGGDVEYQELISAGGDLFVSPLTVPVGANDASSKPFDGVLSVSPGDEIVAMWFVADLDPKGPQVEEQIIYDYALSLDTGYAASPSTILPELALTEDELSPPPGGKPLATLIGRGGLPVQVPVNELIFYPRDQEELNRFLEFSKGTVLGTNDDTKDDPDATGLAAVLVGVDPDGVDSRFLPQLRKLFGQEGELFSSNQKGFDIFQLAILSQLEGFIVALNPRLQFADAPDVSEGMPGVFMSNLDRSPEGVLNVPELWSFMSLHDFDEQRIPMAIMDIGFSPNPDFRGFDEDTLQGCALNGLSVDCSPGAAFGIPTVGNSLFGEKSWHGNGVVTIAGGVLNNGWGSAGVGGQVVVPIPYKYDLASYAFGIGTGIRHATLNGAAVINLSAGYPCLIQTELGGFNICDPGSRAAFCAAVTASVATAAGAACAATSAFLPFLAPFVCTAATVATVAAGEACIALVAAGDVREPMRSAIEFARDRGVPVVTIAGNNIPSEALPEVIRDLIDLSDSRVETWEIYPAMVPDAIVVGATSSDWPYENLHFFGNRVDIWAPIRASYFAPVDATAVRPFTEHVLYSDESGGRGGIGGTSAAAPYVAGVIAAMQAANPNLNPRTPGLSETQRRSIVNQIKALIDVSAWTVSELSDLAPDEPTADAVMAGLTERRNLVNPLRAIQLATLGIVPAFESMGYETTLGFSETDLAERHDTETSALTISSGDAFSNGIYSHPGERRTPDWHDVDWFSYSTPASPASGPGLYETRFELRAPRGFGTPMIYPRGFRLFRNRYTANENIYDLIGPTVPNGVEVRFRVHGAGIEDYLYQISYSTVVRVGDLPRADRFDVDDPAVNPIESRPNNNIASRGVLLGETGEFEWRFRRGTAFGDHWYIRLPDLSIHELSDIDWFAITDMPPFSLGDPACNPYVEVSFGEKMFLSCFLDDGTTILLGEESPVTIPAFALTDDRLQILLAARPNNVADYDLEFRFFTTNPRICDMASALGDARAAGEARGSGMFGFPGALPEILEFGPGAYDSLPARTIDQMGRVTTPDAYLIQWGESGDFSASFDLLRGDSLMLRLVDASGAMMAGSRTSNLDELPQPQLNNDLPAPASGTSLRLEADDLPAGNYLLLVSHGYLGTQIYMLLPKDATTDGSPSIESVQAGPQPEPPTMEVLKNANDLTVTWPEGFFDFQLQSRGSHDGVSDWQTANENPTTQDGEKSIGVAPDGTEKYFRLMYTEENQ